MYKVIKPLLFTLNPESAHHTTFSIASLIQRTPFALQTLKQFSAKQSNILKTEVFGMSFRNPIGIAAGFDKNGLIPATIEALGFGFYEIGSVSNSACDGNPKPRLFRLPADRALINRMGLNNHGIDTIAHRLAKFEAKSDFRIGLNIVKTNNPQINESAGIADVCSCLSKGWNHCAYITVNISCPNTEEGKTFEDPEILSDLLVALNEVRNNKNSSKTILVKFSPDLTRSQLEQAINICENNQVDGYVCTNTTTCRDNLSTSQDTLAHIGKGGLSGVPLKDLALSTVKFTYHLIGDSKPIIGVGGVENSADAYRMIKSGASLVQIYTSLIYNGPFMLNSLLPELEKLVRIDGFSNISEAKGTGE